jgi:hypothetical protein
MFSLFLHDTWKILVYSLVLGAGLPVLYAVGVRASAYGTVVADGGSEVGEGDGAQTVTRRRRHLLGKTVAGLCFVIVLAGIALGLAYIVASGHGEQLGFQHGYPTFVPKS